MPEVINDIYHEIINSLESNNIVFNTFIRKGTPFKPWIYDNSNPYGSDKYKDCDMLIYLEVSPTIPIYDIASLNKLTDCLLPWLNPIDKIKPEVIEVKRKLLGKETTLLGKKRTIKPGRLVFKEEYEINMTEQESDKAITYPFSMCCIVDIQPDAKMFKKPVYIRQEYDLDKLSTNPWPLK